jgi:hypothetical protein
LSRPEGDRETGDPGPHLDEDLCRDLLNDLVSPEERRRALSHIACCESCERFFAERVVERERLLAARKLRVGTEGKLSVQRLLKPVAGTEPEEGPLRMSRRRSGGPPSLSVARRKSWRGFFAAMVKPQFGIPLGLAATGVLLVILWPQERESVLPRHLPSAVGDVRMRAAVEETADSKLMEGLAAYAARDYEKAVDLLRSAEVSGQMEIVRKIYLGSALTWQERYGEAVEALRGVKARTLPDPWGSETRWTLYVSLKNSGRDEAADSLLDILTGERGEVGDRARRLRDF